jgi:integrase
MSYSKIILYKENADKEQFVIIYYKHANNALRHRTGVSVNTRNWDKKVTIVKPTDTSYKNKNEVIKNSHDLVEQIISDFVIENGIKPTSEYVKKELKLGRKLKKEKIEADIIECYDEFLGAKRIEFSSPDRSISSLKDYTSTKNALLDYIKVNGTVSLNNLNNQIWLSQFNTFLSKTRKEIIGYKFKTSAQNDKTRSKRFSVLKEFGKWLVKNKFLTTIETLNEFRIKPIKIKYYALSLEELKKIQNFRFINANYQKAIDILIVACHCGVRFSDAIRINKNRITNYEDTEILKMLSQKSKEKFEVPLTKKVKEILVKYDYNLNLMAGQKVNKYIHEALELVDGFKEEYEYGTEGDAKPIYKLVTFHTGRRTFITNLVNNNISLNAIMKMTGHKKISTLQGYINPDYPLMIENVKIFNDLQL